MLYNVAAQKVTLDTLGLKDLPLQLSSTGHPALVVSDFGASQNLPCPGDMSFEDSAYMREADQGFTHLFYPKKIPGKLLFLEDQNPLCGAGFFCWWKPANESRDFLVET